MRYQYAVWMAEQSLCSTHSALAVQSVWACVLMALVGFLLALNKERFPKLQSAFSFALLTYPIVAIPGQPNTAALSRAHLLCEKGYPDVLPIAPASSFHRVCLPCTVQQMHRCPAAALSILWGSPCARCVRGNILLRAAPGRGVVNVQASGRQTRTTWSG